MTERLKELFGEALELPREQRGQFLQAACGADEGLRRQLEHLLGAHDDAGDFLAHPAALVDAAAMASTTDDDDDHLAPGQRIGAHELLARLGRGGFGSVWRARQLEPVTREVAMKILHRGFDGERVAQRFLAERQALARMQHPGIAKVFAAGATADGRPWLTMELVEGEPITVACARRRLSLPRRLALFADVCVAVQHAHGKGIVHRDLKPSNVLVTERDGDVFPVIIDFGVARAIDAQREAGMAGEDVPLVGTPDYMSPEQTVADPTAVDTRTDVYSLGVILYELACGQRPHEHRTGEPAHELLQRIRSATPPPPSARTTQRLPREIDWIAARAMAKDQADRYPTAAALADDVRRVLAGEPVLVGPVPAFYRLDRFVRRHRFAVAAFVMVLASLGAGTWLAVRGWLDASAAERRAVVAAEQARDDQRAAEREASRANRALALLDELWSGVDPARLGRADYPVRELLADFERALPARLADEPTVELPVRRTLARLHYFVGLFDRAELHATRAAELAESSQLPIERASALVLRARVRFDRGATAAARDDVERVLRPESAAALPPAVLANAQEVFANCLVRGGDPEGAVRTAEAALALREGLGDGAEIARSQMQLANLHGAVGRVDVAMELVREALDSLRPLGDDHPDAITALQHLAYLEQRRGDLAAAEAGFRDSLERRRRVYGDDHPHVAWAEADLAWLLHERQRDAEASPLLRQALASLRRRLGEQHLYVSEAMQRLGAVAVGLQQYDEAEQLLTEAAERFRTLPGHPVDGLVGCLGNLAGLQWTRGQRQAAKSTQEQALEHSRQQLPAAHYLTSVGMTNLAFMVAGLGDRERAIELLREASSRAAAAGRAGEARLQRQRLAELLRAAGRAEEAAAIEDQGR